MSRKQILAIVALVMAALFWAGNFVVGRAISDSIQPFTLNYMRWAIAALLIAPFVGPKVFRRRKEIFSHWKLFFALSLLGIAGYNVLIYKGLQQTTATNAALMLSVTPVVIATLEWLFFGKSLTKMQWVGVLVSLTGACCVISKCSLEVISTLSFNSGDLWILAAMPIWAIFSVLSTKKPKEFDPVLMLFTIILIGLGISTTPFVYEILTVPMTWNLGTMISIGYVGVFASVIAYAFYFSGIESLGASRAGIFLHLIPLFSATLAFFLLGESIGFHHLFGALLIFGGIAITNNFKLERILSLAIRNQKPVSLKKLRVK